MKMKDNIISITSVLFIVFASMALSGCLSMGHKSPQMADSLSYVRQHKGEGPRRILMGSEAELMDAAVKAMGEANYTIIREPHAVLATHNADVSYAFYFYPSQTNNKTEVEILMASPWLDAAYIRNSQLGAFLDFFPLSYINIKLLEKEYDPNIKEGSMLALSRAALIDSRETAIKLLNKGANADSAINELKEIASRNLPYLDHPANKKLYDKANLGVEMLSGLKKEATETAQKNLKIAKPERGVDSGSDPADAIAYQRAKSLDTLPAYTEFLHAHPSSPSRQEALKAMSRIIKTQGGSYESYKKFVVEYEDGLAFVPSQHRLTLTGPEGMRVHDIIKLLKRGINDTVIAAKIRTRNALYKNFDFDEIASLKKTGITDALVAAMIDSTTRAKRGQEELQKKKEMEDLLAEIQRTQKKLDAMKAAQEQQQQPQTVAQRQQAGGPSLGDTVKNCAAQIAALEACKQLPWPASSVCAATAKSQFPCQ